MNQLTGFDRWTAPERSLFQARLPPTSIKVYPAPGTPRTTPRSSGRDGPGVGCAQSTIVYKAGRGSRDARWQALLSSQGSIVISLATGRRGLKACWAAFGTA